MMDSGGIMSSGRSGILRIGVLFCALVAWTTVAHAQVRSAFLDQPSEILQPRGLDDTRRYPLVVFLPYTGGDATAQARAFGVNPGFQTDYFVMLPPGRYQRGDYLPSFTRFVGWIEERVVTDIRAALRENPIDPNRIYVVGYSLGGDLSWALAVRNPDLIDGVVMAGTRASYPVSQAELAAFRDGQKRFSLIIGNRESSARHDGINRVRLQLEGAGVEVDYREYVGGHTIPPQSILRDALAFVSDGGAIPVATRPAAEQEQRDEPSRRAPAAEPVPDETPGRVPDRRPGQDDATATAAGELFRAFLNSRPSGFAALRWVPPAVASAAEETSPLDGIHQVQLRYEAFAGNLWLRGSTEYISDETTTDERLHRAFQTAAVGTRGIPSLSIGAGWTWASWFAVDDQNVFVLPRFMIMGHLLHGGGAAEITGVATASYRIPASFSPVYAADFLNAELRYRVEFVDLVTIELGGATFAQQSAPRAAAGDRLPLDWVVQWNLGMGVRLPTRLNWGLTYTAERRAEIATAYEDASYDHMLQIMVELLF